MAGCDVKKLNIILVSGLTILILIFILFGAIIAIIVDARDLPLSSILREHYIRSVFVFTLWQAFLSTVLTIVFAIPIARALHRRPKFFCRSIIVKITSLSFILPSVVLVLGIAVIHGKNGWINKFLSIYGLSFDYYLYGMFGILVAHMAFSLPLAIRVFLNKLESIPQENWKLASQLGFKAINILKVIELPILGSSVAGVSILIFMMCFTSFAIVLNLGGGPNYTTIEVAIYQALRFDFDIERAVALSIIQFTVCCILMLCVAKFLYHSLFVEVKEKYYTRPDTTDTFNKIIDGFFIFSLLILVVLPLLSVLISGLNQRFFFVIYTQEFWSAFGFSLYISILSGIISLIFAPGLLAGSFYVKYYLRKTKLASKLVMLSNFSMVMSPFIFITGLFILLKQFIDVFESAVYLTILVNSIMALPFVVAVLFQSVTSFTQQEIWLCESLNLQGWNFFRLVCWGRIRKAVGYAFALAVTMSWGDLSVVTLFGNNDFITLPYLLYQNMSNYRVSDASVIAFVILVISYTLFMVIEEFVGGENNAAI